MTLKFEKTNRGFARGVFEDANGVECSLQESSAMNEEGLIWLGANSIGLKELIPGRGWTDIPTTREHNANTRMHLNQTQVKNLLPALIFFAENGYLPDEDEQESNT